MTQQNALFNRGTDTPWSPASIYSTFKNRERTPTFDKANPSAIPPPKALLSYCFNVRFRRLFSRTIRSNNSSIILLIADSSAKSFRHPSSSTSPKTPPKHDNFPTTDRCNEDQTYHCIRKGTNSES